LDILNVWKFNDQQMNWVTTKQNVEPNRCDTCFYFFLTCQFKVGINHQYPLTYSELAYSFFWCSICLLFPFIHSELYKLFLHYVFYFLFSCIAISQQCCVAYQLGWRCVMKSVSLGNFFIVKLSQSILAQFHMAKNITRQYNLMKSPSYMLSVN
jgi:hypothetical protein